MANPKTSISSTIIFGLFFFSNLVFKLLWLLKIWLLDPTLGLGVSILGSHCLNLKEFNVGFPLVRFHILPGWEQKMNKNK